MARADWLPADTMTHLLAALMPQNSLALRVSLWTGLRISDVLSLRRADLDKGRRFTVKEQKTGKSRRIYLPEKLYDELRHECGRWYVFEHRTDPKKHRTRQAVYKDLTRAADLFRVPRALHVSPHSARKIYAAEMFKQYGDPKKVQQLLNHSSEAVTMLYLIAEQVAEKKLAKRRRSERR